MKIISVLQQRFGFARNEILIIAFLAGALLVGAAVRRLAPLPAGETAPRFDYSAADSEYAAKVRALALLAPERLSSGGAPGVMANAQAPGGRDGPGRTGKVLPAPASIDLNRADSAALVRLPGIGPAYARRIIAYRAAHGPFAAVSELVKVRGIGPATLEKLRVYATARRDTHAQVSRPR